MRRERFHRRSLLERALRFGYAVVLVALAFVSIVVGGAIDVLEHPLGKAAPLGIRTRLSALAPDVAPICLMAMGGIDHLAHRDSNQKLPQLFAAGGRSRTTA